MEAIFSLGRHSYLKAISAFLVATALIAAVVGCEGEGEPAEYDLATNSTAGGAVTDPGEGIYTYDDGTIVELVATPECGYAFDVWTGDTGTVADINAASTNITMDSDYSVTANFRIKPLDHLRCYWMEGPPPAVAESVQLEDQFGIFDVTVGQVVLFASPVEKVHDDVTTPISDPDNHLTFYELDYDEADEVTRTVEVSNQFGTYELTVAGPLWLAAPTQKLEPGAHEGPECLDHFLLYQVTELSPEIGEYVDLTDQFGSEQGVGVFSAGFLANPVRKTHDSVVTDIKDPEEHLVLYWTDSTHVGIQVQVSNQFGELQVLNVQNSELLAVPSQKFELTAPMVAAGFSHTVGLKEDTSVVAVGNNDDGQCNTGDWTSITQVDASFVHTVGCKFDGTVVATGYDPDGRCDVGGWVDIVQVAAGWHYTVGLKSDGTAIATGSCLSGRCDVGGWTNIARVAVCHDHTVGLKLDGTAVAVGLNDWGQCNVGNWTNIAQIAAGYVHTVGLRDDGTVIAVGRNNAGQCNVGSWTGITQVAAGWGYTLGLKSDGTVVATGSCGSGECDVGGWTDIIQVAAGYTHTVGLKDDGTVVATGSCGSGQCNLGGWDLN